MARCSDLSWQTKDKRARSSSHTSSLSPNSYHEPTPCTTLPPNFYNITVFIALSSPFILRMFPSSTMILSKNCEVNKRHQQSPLCWLTDCIITAAVRICPRFFPSILKASQKVSTHCVVMMIRVMKIIYPWPRGREWGLHQFGLFTPRGGDNRYSGSIGSVHNVASKVPFYPLDFVAWVYWPESRESVQPARCHPQASFALVTINNWMCVW